MLVVLAPAISGCLAHGPRASGTVKARVATPTAAHVAELAAEPAQARLLAPRWAGGMRAMVERLTLIRQPGRAEGRDRLLPREQDALEAAFAEYLACRGGLAAIETREAASLTTAGGDASGPPNPSAQARWQRLRGDALLVLAGLDDPVLLRALNQEFHRSGIARGTFDDLLGGITHPQTLSWLEDTQPTDDSPALVAEILRRKSGLWPDGINRLRHASASRVVTGGAHATRQGFLDAKAGVSSRLTTIRVPLDRTLSFTADQRAQIRAVLLPGDVLISYTAGMVGNAFVPGRFKHSQTYVGTAHQRRAAGLTPDHFAGLAPAARKDPWAPIMLEGGREADLVESISAGVLFGNLDTFLETRINRLVVLRPRLSPEERVAEVVDVMAFVGDEYDFQFDFADGSDQVCTELIYRSLQGRGGIEFTLTDRAGQATLTPDDILEHCLRAEPRRLDCVLVVDEDPQAADRARVHYGSTAGARLAQIMTSRDRALMKPQAIAARPSR
jgi:hypothetical protein